VYVTFTDISRIAPIKQQLPENISFDQIRVVMAILKHRYGFTDNDAIQMVFLLELIYGREMKSLHVEYI